MNVDDHELARIQYSTTRTIPLDMNRLRERRVIAGMKHDPRAGVFRMLRTRVLQEMRANGWNSLAVVSARDGAGKSLIAANLAVAMATDTNQSVLVVDADLRSPKVGWYFNIETQKGLLDYLEGGTALEEILVNPGFPRLVVIPGSKTTLHASELLASPRMTRLVQELKSKYASRMIIFDLPPVLMTDEAILFMPNYDAVLFVVEEGGTTAEELDASLQALEGTNLLGVVLNKATTVSETDYYGPKVYANGSADAEIG